MNRTTEKICVGHYLIKTVECGQFSVSKHEGVWVLRNEGHLIDSFPTKKKAMCEISERQRIVRQINWEANQSATTEGADR
jgi:hypothetical protein